MGDLLSASSLLMAVTAILFSLWFSPISDSLEIQPKKNSVDNRANYRKTTITFISKAIPITIISTAVSAIFIPDAINIIEDSILGVLQGKYTTEDYSAVHAAYCLVTTISCLITIYTAVLSIKLFLLRRKLDPNRKQ